MKKFLSLISFLLFASTLAGCQVLAPETSTQTARVGVILPLSGEMAPLGEKVKDGLELAAADWRADNPDWQVEINYQDGQFSPQESLTAAQWLLGNFDPQIIIGPFGPDPTLAVAPTVRQQAPDTPVIAVSLCSDLFLDQSNVFCIFPNEIKQLVPVIDKIKDMNFQRVVFVGFNNSAVDNFLTTLPEELGDSLIAVERTEIGETDYSSIVTKFKALDPDCVIYATIPSFAFAQEMMDQGLSGELNFELGEFDEEQMAKAPEAFEGHIALGAKPTASWFAEHFQSAYDQEPDFYAQIGYDSMMTALTAIRDDEGDLAASLQQVQLEQPAMSGFGFDENRRAEDVEMALFVIRDGKYVYEPES